MTIAAILMTTTDNDGALWYFDQVGNKKKTYKAPYGVLNRPQYAP